MTSFVLLRTTQRRTASDAAVGSYSCTENDSRTETAGSAGCGLSSPGEVAGWPATTSRQRTVDLFMAQLLTGFADPDGRGRPLHRTPAAHGGRHFWRGLLPARYNELTIRSLGCGFAWGPDDGRQQHRPVLDQHVDGFGRAG